MPRLHQLPQSDCCAPWLIPESVRPEVARRFAGDLLDADENPLSACQWNPALHCFFSASAPRLTFEDYLVRLMTYCRCSPECFVFAAIYTLRLRKCGLPVSQRSVHRVYLASLVLAIKYRDDFFHTLAYYAQCGGVMLPELRAMEMQCFSLLGFDCSVSLADMQLFFADESESALGKTVAFRERDVAISPREATAADRGCRYPVAAR